MDRDLEGRVVLITGANTGIGRVTARELARRGAKMWLAGRSRERTQAALDEVAQVGGSQAGFLPLDLADFDSVKACAQAFVATGDPLHILVNNAGLAGARGLTRHGFEMHFGINTLGPVLLTELLLPVLKKTPPARIVTVASRAHSRFKTLDWDALRRPTQSASSFAEYAASKLGNVWHMRHLAERLKDTGVHTYALHPGVIASDIWRKVPWPIRPLMHRFMEDAESGARTSLWCAASPELAEETGGYYDRMNRTEPAPLALDNAQRDRFWALAHAAVADWL